MMAACLMDEAERLAALHRLQILDTPAEAVYDETVSLAAQICAVPIAALSLIDEHRQWFKSIIGLDLKETPRDISCCTHAIQQPDLFVVPDLAADPRFAQNPLVIGEPHVRFYAGLPLIDAGRNTLGTLCVLDYHPRCLTLPQQNALRVLGRNIVSHLDLRRHVLEQEQRQAEQNAAAQAVRESAARLDEAQQIAKIGSWKLNILTGESHWSEQMYRLLGYEPGQGKPSVSEMIIRFHPDDATWGRATLAHTLSAAVPCALDLRIVLPSGELRWCHIAGHPVKNNAGQMVQIVGILHDITERKLSDSRLLRAEEKYRNIFTNAAHGIYQATPEGSLLSANPALAQILGYDTPEDMLPLVTNIADVFCEADTERQAFSQKIKIGTESSFECRTRRRNGEFVWLAVKGNAVADATGKVLLYEGSVEDITERRELEAEREALLDQTELLLADALERADRDPLTGLLNHRAFHRRLQEEADRVQRIGQSLGIALLDLSGFKFFNDAYGHLAGDQVLRHVAQALQSVCRSYDTIARFGGDEFAVLLPGALAEDKVAAVERLASAASRVRFVPPGHENPVPITLSVGMAFFPQDAAGRMDVLALADEELLRLKSGGGEAAEDAAALCHHLSSSKSGFTMLHALITAVDNKDRYTRRHSEDVMTYSLQIARALGLSAEQQQTIAIAALLHDVGKIGVPDSILRKPGPLTDAEFDAMREHPMMGSVIVGAVPGFEDTLDAVRHHHERWDGQGYPFGLLGEEIPLSARLMAVADAFSAMTTHRPYRRGMPQEKALSILQAGSGSQWDPDCVQAFAQCLLEMPSIPQ